ncbi:MAG: DNA polymerase III subunit alpha, partial [Elusimicrobiota bacterium]
YSLLDGMARFSNEKGEPTQMLEKMAKQGFTHQALTDHGNMCGAIEFYKACEAARIKPILGCEIYVASGSRFDKKGASSDEDSSPRTGIHHLTLLARNNAGYQNLIELVTKASLEGFYYKPRVDKELLAQHSDGLLALSGCLKGEVAQAIVADNVDLATQRATALAEIFGPGNFYLEVMDHGLEAQKKVAKALLEMSSKTGLPLVATNDCHYFQKDEAAAHDALLCIGTGKKINDSVRMRYATQEFYYKTPQEMAQLFHLYPQTIANTLRIAEACDNVKISFDELHLPDYLAPEGYNQESYLDHLCQEGLKTRFPAGAPGEYQERLKYELQIIKKMGFPGYFLIVWDFIRFAKRSGVPVGPGRGSGAGSLVSYLLNITNVDPLKYRLLFERFLNPDRREMPDLDIDFSDEGRDMVIRYVREKYGFSNVAQIITFGTMQSRAVIRDVGRVMDVPLQEVDRIAKAIPHGMTIEQALKSSQEFKRMSEENPTVNKILAIAIKLEGVRRHSGVHAAGTVITKEPVTKYAPLVKNTHSGVVTTGFNDKSLVKLGLLKVDFLGLRTLTVIQKTVALVAKTRRVTLEMESIPYDDPKAYELLSRAQTGGVFQLESSGMRELLTKLKPAKLTDIIALIALFRPGPMKWIDEFCARKNGSSQVRYDHPVLESILKETYGICVYQEQVMEISKQLAGFTASEADKLRKAMGKKKPEELNKMEAKFLEGAKAKKIDLVFAAKLFEDLKDFGHYAFNKSHSTAYGIVAYQTAYLKANFPIEFMTALVNSEIGRSAVGSEDKENKIATYLAEAKTMGFETRPPCVNNSEEKFSGEGSGIRFGLEAVKNVGESAAGAIVEERRRAGPYVALKDFMRRASKFSINKKVFESLGKAGALDCILDGANVIEKRGRFIQHLDFHMNLWTKTEGEMLFELDIAAPKSAPGGAPPVEDDILHWEREVLGVYLSIHPMQRWQGLFDACGLPSIEGLRAKAADERVQFMGMVNVIKKQVSKKTGQPWARLRVEDLSGEIETV